MTIQELQDRLAAWRDHLVSERGLSPMEAGNVSVIALDADGMTPEDLSEVGTEDGVWLKDVFFELVEGGNEDFEGNAAVIVSIV